MGSWQWGQMYNVWQNANYINTGYEKRWGELPKGYIKFHQK
jgi:hypothetical protein